MQLELPIPPSVNNCYTTKSLNGKVLKFPATNFLNYIKEIQYIIKKGRFKPFKSKVRVNILACYNKRKFSDIDNLLKVLLDSLQHSKIIKNDKDVWCLSIERVLIKEPSRLIVNISDYSDTVTSD